MKTLRSMVMLIPLVGLAGCHSPTAPIFPAISPALVWPGPPDRPRIRYVGELRGEASLGVEPRGWDAFKAVITGPPATVEFVRPSAVAVIGERVYVADAGLGIVHLLDLAARRYAAIRGAPDDPLEAPVDVVALANETIAVVDRRRAATDLLDLNGQWQSTWRAAEMRAPTAAAWNGDREQLWVVDVAAHACFAWRRGEIVQRFGRRGGAPGQFNFPSAVAWHPSVGLVVADAMNFRVQVFDDAGGPQAVFGQKGDAAGDFARPRDVAVDSEGHIYVLDNQFENVQIFDREGRLLMAFGQSGAGPGQFALPAGITIDPSDRIWIADGYNRRVQVFQYLPEEI